jgi:hypothetical protein
MGFTLLIIFALQDGLSAHFRRYTLKEAASAYTGRPCPGECKRAGCVFCANRLPYLQQRRIN